MHWQHLETKATGLSGSDWAMGPRGFQKDEVRKCARAWICDGRPKSEKAGESGEMTRQEGGKAKATKGVCLGVVVVPLSGRSIERPTSEGGRARRVGWHCACCVPPTESAS